MDRGKPVSNKGLELRMTVVDILQDDSGICPKDHFVDW